MKHKKNTYIQTNGILPLIPSASQYTSFHSHCFDIVYNIQNTICAKKTVFPSFPVSARNSMKQYSDDILLFKALTVGSLRGFLVEFVAHII